MKELDPRIEKLVDLAKHHLSEGATRDRLGEVLAELESLAGARDLWSPALYPDPTPDEQQARYLVREEEDRSFALYCNVMRPGKRIPPHNHTTWACVAAVEGTEHNALFERRDGGTEAGPATIRKIREVEVRPGSGIALMPDDIHSVEIRGQSIIRHLHFYGRALETLTNRLVFDTELSIAKPMTIGLATRRRHS